MSMNCGFYDPNDWGLFESLRLANGCPQNPDGVAICKSIDDQEGRCGTGAFHHSYFFTSRAHQLLLLEYQPPTTTIT